MAGDGPIQRLLAEVEETADAELAARLGVDPDRLDELQELLAAYRDELQAVHDEYGERLADAGFDGVLDAEGDVTTLDGDDDDSGADEEGRDGSTGP